MNFFRERCCNRAQLEIREVANQMLDLVLELYERLKPNYKETFNLFYFKCLKVSEISKQLNISENAVKKRLERARKTIKEALTRSGY